MPNRFLCRVVWSAIQKPSCGCPSSRVAAPKSGVSEKKSSGVEIIECVKLSVMLKNSIKRNT